MPNGQQISEMNRLMWCIVCNIPYLESDLTKVDVCPKCHQGLREIKLNRSKEIVIAFDFDKKRIIDTVKDRYGSGIEGEIRKIFELNEIILMSHVRNPNIYSNSNDEYLEDAFEVIAEGRVICILSFSYVRGWNVILNPYVFDVPPDIKKHALDLIDHMNKSNGVNSTFVPSDKALKISRYTSLNETIEANAFILDALRDNSIKLAKQTINKHDHKEVFSGFSGGKDSQLTILMLLEAGIRPILFFSDIEVELPGTRDFVISFAERKGLELVIKKPPDFFENMYNEGPPTRGNRWCTDQMKVINFHNHVMDNLPQDRVVNFLGIRAEESNERRRDGYEVIYGNEITSRPIFHWGCLHLWFHLIRSGEPYLKWYEQGVYRTGCWLCPFASTSQLDHIKNTMPEVWDRYQGFLEEYARKKHFSKAWYDQHLWRFGYFIPKEVRRMTGFREPPMFKMKKWIIFLKGMIGKKLGAGR